jgi:hypothetical protein
LVHLELWGKNDGECSAVEQLGAERCLQSGFLGLDNLAVAVFLNGKPITFTELFRMERLSSGGGLL